RPPALLPPRPPLRRRPPRLPRRPPLPPPRSSRSAMKTLRLALILAFPLVVPASRAAAQAAQADAPPADQQQPANAAPKVKVEKGAGGKKIYRITDEIRIEGKIQKPEAFFFYQKSSINYDWQELKKDFIPKILDSVSHAPF